MVVTMITLDLSSRDYCFTAISCRLCPVSFLDRCGRCRRRVADCSTSQAQQLRASTPWPSRQNGADPRLRCFPQPIANTLSHTRGTVVRPCGPPRGDRKGTRADNGNPQSAVKVPRENSTAAQHVSPP